jgi:hypothetical protein
MSVLDRVNRQRHREDSRALTAGESPETGQWSTPEVRSPVVIRLQAVMSMLQGVVINGGEAQLSRYAFLMQALTDEVIEELTDKDEATIGTFMEGMGEVIAWIGHGDNDRLPDPLKSFAEEIQPPIPIQA